MDNEVEARKLTKLERSVLKHVFTNMTKIKPTAFDSEVNKALKTKNL